MLENSYRCHHIACESQKDVRKNLQKEHIVSKRRIVKLTSVSLEFMLVAASTIVVAPFFIG